MKKKFAWRNRYNLVVVMFLVGLLLMFDRAVISTAMPVIERDLNLSPVSMGLVLGAFSLAYALMQIPGGLLADKFGSRLIGVISIIFWSIFTFLTGIAANLSALVGIRFAFGLGEGAYIPAQYKALAVWFPKKERGRAISLTNISMMVGTAMTAIIAAALIGKFGWRPVFFSLFVPGLLLAALFWFIVKDSPSKSKKISAMELEEINADDTALEEAGKVKVGDIFKYPVVWQLYAVYFVSAMVSFGVNSWLSVYVVDVLHGTLMQFGVATLIVSVGALFGQVLGGILADKSRATQKYQMFVSWILAALFLYLAISSDNFNIVIGFFVVELFFFMMATSAFFARMSTALPRKAMGLGAGIIQTSGYIAGAISPVLIGYIVEATGGSYRSAFISMCALLVLAALLALTIQRSGFQEKTAPEPVAENGQPDK